MEISPRFPGQKASRMINSGIAPKFPGIASSQHVSSVKSPVFTKLVAICDNDLGKFVDFYRVSIYNDVYSGNSPRFSRNVPGSFPDRLGTYRLLGREKHAVSGFQNSQL